MGVTARETWSGPLPHPRERPWLSVPEAGARLAGLGRSASFEAVRRGDIPSLKIGRKVVVPTASIWALLSLHPDGNAPACDQEPCGDVVALDERRSGS